MVLADYSSGVRACGMPNLPRRLAALYAERRAAPRSTSVRMRDVRTEPSALYSERRLQCGFAAARLGMMRSVQQARAV